MRLTRQRVGHDAWNLKAAGVAKAPQ